MTRKTFFNQEKSKIELADIFRVHIGDYQKKYKLHPEHYAVVYDILNCRQAYLGGRVEKCDRCGTQRYLYNSCRNRHCPKCQTLTKQRWLEARKAELLPTVYFHTVFTLPHELNPVVLVNKRVLLNLLFRSASETLMQFGRNPDNGLGGTMGFITFLHTWDQRLKDHFHLHCLIPGGVLSLDGRRWLQCPHDYLFSQKALGRVFRGKFMDYLTIAYEHNELEFHGNCLTSGTRKGFVRLKKQLWVKDWVVDIAKPIRQPEHVLEYVGRYTHRVAISNDRILSLHEGQVTFAYKDRKKDVNTTMTIDAVAFIRRFLLHVLPKRFMRIRHYGYLANRCKKEKIGQCRRLLGLPAALPTVVEKTVYEMMFSLTGNDITKCPCCKEGTMHKVLKIPKGMGDNAFRIIRPSELRKAA
jgi:hypothetical protein